MRKTFKSLDFIVGDQRRAELLLDDYLAGNFDSIIDYCNSAEVFQDCPFSYPETYKYLDMAFPRSKFILTIRDDTQEWCNSVIKFHSKRFGNGSLPSKRDLENSSYVYKGWIWKTFLHNYSPKDENDLYNRENLSRSYENHNNEVLEYFKNRPNDLLVINLKRKDSFSIFIKFLGINPKIKGFPWEKKTSKIIINKN